MVLELEPDDDGGVDIVAWTGCTFLGVSVVLRGVSGAGQCRAVGAVACIACKSCGGGTGELKYTDNKRWGMVV